MIDLEKTSGLPIEVGENYALKFKPPLEPVIPNIRKLWDMKAVLMDPTAKSTREEMYYMYRNVVLKENAPILAGHNLRYDITVIPPAMIGHEYTKTVGHYHPFKGNSKIAYPEIYEVLHGKLLFLLQKMDSNFQVLSRVLACEGRPGDKIILPPNYGHVMINIGQEVLVTANWSADKFESLYQPVAARKGMAYYVIKAPTATGYHFIPNPHYENHPEVQWVSESYRDNFDIVQPKPMYTLGSANPRMLDFLNEPERYAVDLSSISS